MIVSESRQAAAGIQATATAFAALFSVVGLSLYGLPLYYDFMVRELGWSRTMVTSGNAISKLIVGPLFGFAAGWIVDRFGPRRLMMAGIVMAGGALVGLGAVSAAWTFYFFYFFNALGYVCGGPLPSQVLLSRWFDRDARQGDGDRVPRHRHRRRDRAAAGEVDDRPARLARVAAGARRADRADRVSARVLRSRSAGRPPWRAPTAPRGLSAPRGARLTAPPYGAILRSPAFYLLALGSMCSIAAVGGTNQHLKLFLSLDRGYSQGDAARIISLVLAVSIAGRLLMGWLADRMPRKHVMLIIYLLVATARFRCCCCGRRRTTMYVFAAIFGLGLGGEYLIIPLMAGELFGVARRSAA